jgi:predicted metal-dependent hydrolase
MKKTRINYAKLYINNDELTYRIKYSRKARYLRLQINPSTGLEVVIPRGYKLEEAERFIYKKRDWILKHLKATPAKEEFAFLGEKIEIKQRYDLFLNKHKISYNKNVLLIESPPGSNEDIQILYNAWLKHLAKRYLPERTLRLAHYHNFNFKQVRIRSQKTRWGSCSASGNISLNYRLIKYRKELIDYVIIHELCHLKEMNHSQKFWKLLEEIVPDFRLLMLELKTSL